jgi:uncharacterized protein DUF6427
VTAIFKTNNPFNAFFIFLYALVLKFSMFLHPAIPYPQQTDGFLFKLLLKSCAGVAAKLPFFYPLITFTLLYIQAIVLNKFSNDKRLLQQPNYLVAMSYTLLTSLFPEWNVLSAPLIVATLLVWVWVRMSTLYNNPKPQTTLFNIGFIIGIATFFYFPSIAFALLIVLGLILTMPFKLTEWLTALIGIVSPYYFLLSYVFLTDKWKGYKFPGVTISYPQFARSSWALAAIIIVLVVSLIGFFFVQQNLRRQLVQTRKSWNLVLIYLLVAVFVPFINATHTFEYWILCAIPLSMFIAATFQYPRVKWLPAVLHWLMVGFVVATSYFI